MITFELITKILTNEGWEEKYRSGIILLIGLSLTIKVKNKHLVKKGSFSKELLNKLGNLNRVLDSDVYDFLVNNLDAIFNWVNVIQISENLSKISGHKRRTLKECIGQSNSLKVFLHKLVINA